MDLVVDTNSLRPIMGKKDRIIERNDLVFIPRCVIRKEAPVVLKHVWWELYGDIRDLKSRNRLKVINPKNTLPNNLERELRGRSLSKCDKDLVKVALWRKGMNQVVRLVTTGKRDFHEVSGLARYLHSEEIIFPEEYDC